MAKFTGSLNTNEFYNGLFNAYSLIKTIGDNLSGLSANLADKFREDGGAYHDKSVWTFVDVLKSRVWDPSDTNLLETEQKVAPLQQEITVNQKRQIGLTTDEYLTKRVWMNEGSFSQFNTVVQAQVGNTKKLYDQRMVDVSVGTMVATCKDFSNNTKGSSQNPTAINLSGKSDTERVRIIGKTIANIFADLKDSSRDYNDLGLMTSYNKEDLMIIWNKAYLNEFNIVDLPVIFHKDGILPTVGDELNGKYFGDVATSSDVGSNKIIKADGTYDNTKGNLRFLEETEISNVDYMPGDLVPNGTAVYDTAKSKFEHACYVENAKVICKICHKDSIKYLSSFETSTDFFNRKNLSTNRYLTWLYAKPDYLKGYPLVTVKEA